MFYVPDVCTYLRELIIRKYGSKAFQRHVARLSTTKTRFCGSNQTKRLHICAISRKKLHPLNERQQLCAESVEKMFEKNEKFDSNQNSRTTEFFLLVHFRSTCKVMELFLSPDAPLDFSQHAFLHNLAHFWLKLLFFQPILRFLINKKIEKTQKFKNRKPQNLQDITLFPCCKRKKTSDKPTRLHSIFGLNPKSSVFQLQPGFWCT